MIGGRDQNEGGQLAIRANETPTQTLPYRGHIAGLDSLRGTAVLSVMLCHAYAYSTDWHRWHGVAAVWIAFTVIGHLGVHLFFVLSGFLITGILLDSKQRPPTGRARRFYGRRVRRILPAYLVILAILGLTRQVDWRFIVAALLFVVNSGRVFGIQLSQYALVWSLAVEEQFYLVWPWVLWRCSNRSILRVILACLLLSPLLRLALAMRGADTYVKTYSNLDYLMYGALIALLLRTGQLHQGNLRRVAQGVYLGAVAGIALLGALFATVHAAWLYVLFESVGRLPFIALFVGLVLSSLLAHEAAGLAPPRKPYWQRTLAFLGYISYGLYLVHPLIARFYDARVAGTLLGGFTHSFALLTLRALVCTLISILVAWLSRSTLEAWFLRDSTHPTGLQREEARQVLPPRLRPERAQRMR